MTPSEQTAHEIVQFLNDQRDYVVPKEWYERIAEIVGRGEKMIACEESVWVSAEERLPEKAGHTLVYFHTGIGWHMRISYFLAGHWYQDGAYSVTFSGVTHWRLLPEPPLAGQRSTVEPERSGKDYAIEHGGYLATAAQNYLEEKNRYDMAAAGLADEEVADSDSLADHHSALWSAIYEFRKRAERAVEGQK